MTERETAYRNALMWAFDRLTTDGLTPKEIRTTAREIGNVLMGRPSPAGRDDSAKLVRALGEKDQAR